MDPTDAARPAFAHASEAEFARILDFYEVRWEYEPRTFPILWNLDGAVVESFAPDFWLPDLELYVEMTTLRQSLVRKKNRKLRRLRELYPDIRIKLFYGRDFRALMLKYGKLGLFQEMSGTLGQATPPIRRAGALVGAANDSSSIDVAIAASPGEAGPSVGHASTAVPVRTVMRQPAAAGAIRQIGSRRRRRKVQPATEPAATSSAATPLKDDRS
jgi:hypothetical protein